MNDITVTMAIGALFIIFGVIALASENDTISARRTSTQILFIIILSGGLLTMDGNWKLGLLMSVTATVAYLIRLREHQKTKEECQRMGIRMPTKKEL